MSRLMFLLSLLAALAGTPLRQAEAADDLARALSDGGAVATIDGGVGDDAGDAIKTDAALVALAIDALPAPFPHLVLLPAPAFLSRRDQLRPPPPTSSRRHALLQRFLF